MKISERKKLARAVLTKTGGEIGNPKPLFIADGQIRESIEDKIARMIKTEKIIQNDEIETFEESQDFDVEDDFEVEETISRYQIVHEEYVQPPEITQETSGSEVSDPPKGSETVVEQPTEITEETDENQTGAS